MCTVNTGIITKVKLAPSPRAFLTVEELFTFHISPRPTSSRLSKQTERVSGVLKINGRTFIKQQKVLKSRFGRAFIEARPPLGIFELLRMLEKLIAFAYHLGSRDAITSKKQLE